MIGFFPIYLLHQDIPSQEHGDKDTQQEEDVAQGSLWSRSHELIIIDTEEKTHREYGEEAAIEHLGHEDHKYPVN